MITENTSTLKIHKLTKEQYVRELEAGNIDETALYLTPDETADLTIYASKEEVEAVETKVDANAENITELQSDVAQNKTDISSNATAISELNNTLDTHASSIELLNTNKVDTTDSRLSDARTPTEHNHDDRYYTVTTAQNLLNGKLSTSGRVSYIGLDTSGLYLTIDGTNYQVPFGINTSEILRTTGGYLTGGGVISNDGNILSPVWGNDWLSNVIASKQDTSTAINAYNIGNQSVNYANSAGSASWAVQCRDESGVKIRSGSYMDVFNYADSGYQAVRAYSFNTMSSKLTKENVLPMEEDEAKKILKLNPITFDYKQNFGGQKNLRGLIAEDVLNIIPSAVSVPKNYSEENFVESDGIHNDLLSVDYSKFVPYLIKMVQIQQKEIDELKSK